MYKIIYNRKQKNYCYKNKIMVLLIHKVEKVGDPLMKNIFYNINYKLTRERANNILYLLNNIKKDYEVTRLIY